jgi:uncharacterized protein
VLDQENRANLGGQAYWSLGGLFLVDSPEQRRMGIRDSRELAWQDWLGSAAFGKGVGVESDEDEDEDLWGRRWAEAYVAFANSPRSRPMFEKCRQWLRRCLYEG